MDKITLILPAFGSFIPGQGGYFAGIVRGMTFDGIEEPPYALLVADVAVGDAAEIEWGPYGKNVVGAGSHSDGLANTIAMAAAECPAALRVRAFTIDGHSDFYLPAAGELNMAKTNVPELFPLDDDDAGTYWWSSTQGSSGYAFVQDFEDGYSGWVFKGLEHRVRAFRRIPLQLLST